MVKNINSSGNGLNRHDLLTFFGNNVYFPADDGTNGFEVWKSDGTASGTEMVENIGPGSTSGMVEGYIPRGHVGIVGNTVYFVADDGTNGRELWTLSGGSGSGSTTNVTGANCSVHLHYQLAYPWTAARAQLAAHLQLQQAILLTLLQRTLAT